MPKYDALPQYRNPTPEELSKIEKYLKDYVKQSKISPLYCKSVEIPFTDFFDYKTDNCKKNATKYHLTMIEDDKGNLNHQMQTDEEFKKKVADYKKNGFQVGYPRGFYPFKLKILKSPSTRNDYAKYIFTRMYRAYYRDVSMKESVV